MAWLELFTASFFEVEWAIALKYSNGFTRIVPTVLTLAGLAASTVFLVCASKKLPIGTAYTIWTGIGAVGTVILGMILFHEPVSILRIVFLMLVIGGIIGLKMTA